MKNLFSRLWSSASLSIFVFCFGATQVATVVAAPTVTSNPANRAQNAPTVTLSGTGFSATPANNSVVFNLGAVGVVTAATATQLTVTFTTSPTFTGSLTANVTVAGGSSGATQVATVVAAPTLTSNPANRAQNAPTVTLSGTGFSTTPANNSVVFNLGAVGVVTAATATQLTVTFTTSPTFTGSLTANVTVFGGSSGATQVATVVAATVAPQITCPADITTNAAGYCVPTIEFASTVTAGNPAPVVTYTIGTNIITSPYAFPIGINSVTSTATNVAGTDSCSFNVTVAAGDAPQLNILHDSTNVVVSWSDSFSCYTFEFALLLSSNSWSTYPGPYAMNNGKIFVTNSAPFTNRFFRLRF